MRVYSSVLLLFFAFLTLLGSSCKKEQMLSSGGKLEFSTDTLTFDTVFTALGSFTLGIKIYNPQNQKVNISSVRLEKGSSSFFNLNVNGVAGNSASNIELAANDSIYVFATVNIDPTNENNPFIVEDKLVATLNGNEYTIPFFAYGQNAHYLFDSVITQNATWLTDKPYVILHSALVAPGYTLNIPAGCRVYMHADSRLYVQGKLMINGTKEDSVIFQGDRLDRGYFGDEGYPGEWGGIYFDSTSTGNKIEWTVLKNCGNNSGGGFPFAIEVFGRPGIANQLEINNTIIENSFGFGLLGFQANIIGRNNLFHDCGAQALAILRGGTYIFENCDFINYFPSKVAHTDNPTVAVLNYYDISNTEYIEGDLTAAFTNCLIYGSLDNELFCFKRGNTAYKVTMDNCLIKSEDPLTPFTAPDYLTVSNTIFNKDPIFVDYTKWNFRPKPESPLRDNGKTLSIPGVDLDGVTYGQDGATDIGCYEFKP